MRPVPKETSTKQITRVNAPGMFRVTQEVSDEGIKRHCQVFDLE